MPRVLAILATLCLLAAMAYALWPDGSQPGDQTRVEVPEASGSGDGMAPARRAARPGSRTTGTGSEEGEAGEVEAGAVEVPVASEDGAVRVEVRSGTAPVPGARVRLHRRGSRDPNINKVAWSAAGAGRTGEDGAVVLPAPPGRYVVVAEADRLGRTSRPVVRAAGEPLTRVVLALSQPRTLNGRVQARRTREPIPLADVTVVPAPGSDSEDGVEEMPPEERLTMRADARGVFRFQGLAAGSYRVSAAAAGYSSDASEVRLPHAEDVVLELVAAGVLEGYVLAADGKPAVGAQVDVAGADEPINVLAGASGGFSVEVPPGTYRLSARRGAEAGALASPVTVAARTTARGLVLRLGKGATIAGQVVWQGSGEPVAGARVDVSPYLAAGDSGRAIADENGRFSVAGLAPGSYDVVVQGKEITEKLERGITLRNGETYTLRLEVSGTAQIEGLVTDEHGRPLPGALVTEWPPLGDGPGMSAVSDEEGKYLLDGVQVGRVEVTASRGEGSYTVRAVVELSEGEVGRADFTLPESALLEGRVVSKAGGPPRVEVALRLFQPIRRRWHDAEVGEDGTFRLGLPPDEYRLLVLDESGRRRSLLASLTVRVEAEKTTYLEIPVDDSQAAEGRAVQVLEPGGLPSPGATVWVMSGGRPVQGSRTDEAGRASLPPVEGDGMSLRAFNGGRTGEAPLGGRGEITVVLRPAAILRGRVDGGGVPVAGFTLELETVEWRQGGPGPLSFPADELLVTDLPPGKVLVGVFATDGRKGHASVTLAAGATAEVVVRLDAEASQLHARVVDRTGRPLAGAVVRSLEDGRELGRAGVDGRIGVTWPDGGRRGLRFEADGFVSVDRRVDIESGQSFDLGDVALPAAGG